MSEGTSNYTIDTIKPMKKSKSTTPDVSEPTVNKKSTEKEPDSKKIGSRVGKERSVKEY